MSHSRRRRTASTITGLLVAIGVALVSWTTVPATQGLSYTVYLPDGERALPFRTVGGTELVSLNQLAEWFNMTVREDERLQGLTVTVGSQNIVLIPGQAFVSVGGRVDSLSGEVQQQGSNYLVPVDFLSRAVARATGQRIEIRRQRRIIVVGGVRVPVLTPRFESVTGGARLVLEIQPATPHRVSRSDNQLLIRFDAAALDPDTLVDADPAYVTSTSVDGATFVIDLGDAVASFRANSNADDTRLALDLLPPAPPDADPDPRPRPGAEGASPLTGLGVSPTLRTVVIDPGHGGEDRGARGPGGTDEKALTLSVAQRLKSAIERRLGVRVLLTRDGDVNVPIDRRTALANNNKADLYLSLHANASPSSSVRGAQVLTLSLEEYQRGAGSASGPGMAVPLVGGGQRIVDAVPWDLAQIPYALRSADVADILVRRLADANVPLHTRPAARAPLRGLVGANMPAILIEMGFLTSVRDERALASDLSAAIIEAIVNTVTDIRRGMPDRERIGRRP